MIEDSQLVATLLSEGLADQATVDRGIEQTEQTGESLYETLINAELVEELGLVEVMSRLLDIPSRHIDPTAIPDDISALVPASMAHRNRVLPLERDSDGALYLGMANPADTLALDEIATHTGVQILPILIGPSSLAAALSSLYPTAEDSSEVADAVMDAFDDFEVGDYMNDVMPGEEWSDYFDDAEGDRQVEDSSVLSRDMQDRPSTDVLAASDVDEAVAEADEEDLPEIEIIEELGQPIRRRPPSPYASLDEWDVDEAIEGESLIVSAMSAEELFTPSTTRVEPDALEDGEVDETSNLAEISESHTDALETQSSHTTVGIGADHLKDADSVAAGEVRSKKKKRVTVENTGKTQLGLPKDTQTGVAEPDDRTEARDPDADAEGEGEAVVRRRDDGGFDAESADWGALGRAILKSGPKSERGKKNGSKGPPAAAKDGDRPTDPQPLNKAGGRKSNTAVVVALFEDDDEHVEPANSAKTTHARSSRPEDGRKSLRPKASADRKTDPVEPEPDQEKEPEHEARPRLATPVEWPDDIDARGLALALANLLVRKGILSIDEVFELARHFSTGPSE